MSQVRCHAIRRVNPFLGVLQVVESDEGRAISANGVVWDIQLASLVQDGWGSLGGLSSAWSRFGLWSLEEGLVHRPLSPDLGSSEVEELAHALTRVVRERLSELPFALADHLELWLFDADNQLPIALLASAVPGEALPSPPPRLWQATLGSSGVASQRRFPGSGALERMVKLRAGFNLHRHWVQREADGSGRLCKDDRSLPAEAFPSYLITEDWPNADERQLVADFIAWTAPSLLTLQRLAPDQRQRLEASLPIQACSIEHHWQLYPSILDDQQLTAARVQCRLQNASARPDRG